MTVEDPSAHHQTLARQLADPGVPMSEIADGLDALETTTRTAVVRRLDGRDQRLLFERAEGHRPLSLVDLVPADRKDLEPVRHFGRNTLPAFRIFEKRFCRPEGESPGRPETLVGYNHQTMSFVTGPGYFVAVEDPDRGEVLIDYTRQPGRVASGWPRVRSNERGLARFVYGFMVDRLRRVSETVTVGSAARNGRELGSYFVLDREA
jgi:hypothetical protein